MRRRLALFLVLVLLSTGCAARQGDAPAKAAISPPGARPGALYSPAVRAGGLVFLSGVVGTRPDTRQLAEGGTPAELRQALENMRAVLGTAGLGLEDVAKCTVFLADIADYGAMNQVYREFFAGSPPARSAIAVSGLPLGARVEIECIAVARS